MFLSEMEIREMNNDNLSRHMIRSDNGRHGNGKTSISSAVLWFPGGRCASYPAVVLLWALYMTGTACRHSVGPTSFAGNISSVASARWLGKRFWNSGLLSPRRWFVGLV